MRRRVGLLLALLALAGMAVVVWLGRPQTEGAARLADELTIQADVPETLTVFRFAARPAILVLDFAALQAQGRMLNRVAAWAEKAGAPRDRLLNDQELAAAIERSGTTPDEYYFGHDYRAADLVRFFALAARDHVVLREEETRLHRLIEQAAAEGPGIAALISLPRTGPKVSADERAAILHHELSHGEYFSNPVYAGYVAGFWTAAMSGAEREKVRTYLAAEGYDPALEDVMMNEMQAYLMYTPDPIFFDAKRLGIAPDRLAALRAGFHAGMPEGWLRAQTAAPPRP